MRVIYRRPGLDEADALAALHVRCWQESYAGLLDDDFLRGLEPAYRAAIWSKVIPDPRMFAEVAEAGGERIGFVMSGPASASYRHWADGEVHALYLFRAFHGRGIGSWLLKLALANWQRQGGAAVVAMVFSDNGLARGFYEAMGGKAAGEAAFALGGRQLTEIAYVFDFGKL